MFLYYVSYFGQTVNTGRETFRIFCENTAEDQEGGLASLSDSGRNFLNQKIMGGGAGE